MLKCWKGSSRAGVSNSNCSEGQIRIYEATRGPHYDYSQYPRATLWRLRNNGGSWTL